MKALAALKFRFMGKSFPRPEILMGDVSFHVEPVEVPLDLDDENLRMHSSGPIDIPLIIVADDLHGIEPIRHEVPMIAPVHHRGHIEPVEIMAGCIIDRKTHIKVSPRFVPMEPPEQHRPPRDIRKAIVKAGLQRISCKILSTPYTSGGKASMLNGQKVPVLEGKKYVYTKRMILSPEVPKELDKSEMIYFWRELVKITPMKSGVDLEMLSLFRDIEIDRFSHIKFNRKENTLTLEPKPIAEQPGGEVRRYDIIFGVQNGTGLILRAILESG